MHGMRVLIQHAPPPHSATSRLTRTVPSAACPPRRGRDPNYNIYVRTLPAAACDREGGCGGEGGFHWYLEVLPRVFTPDGYQVGTSIAKNSITPEGCAALMGRFLAQQS